MPKSPIKLRNALYGVEWFDPEKHSGLPQQLVRYLNFQQSPPSYILGTALEEFVGQKLPRGDKVAWQALLVFKGALWYLRDWKNSSWILSGTPDSDSLLEELVKKLHRAARSVELRLQTQAKVKIKNGDFAIANQASRLRSYYGRLRGEAEKFLLVSNKFEPPKVDPSIDYSSGPVQLDTSGINDYFDKWRMADAAAAGAVMIFFGLMEVLFDACFAFGDRKGLAYSEFRKMSWKDRFKFVVDVNIRSANTIYCDLMLVQKRFRNVFAHALPTLFVFDDRLGWIPENVAELAEPQMNPIYAFDQESIRSTFAIFDRAIDFFENHSSTWAATRYAMTPLPIPLAPERLAGLKEHTASRDKFEREIERRIGLFDAFVNGEI